MLTALDGYVEDASGGFGWATPDEEGVACQGGEADGYC